MDTYDRIQKLCEANSTTISAMCKAVGINRSVLTELKYWSILSLAFGATCIIAQAVISSKQNKQTRNEQIVNEQKHEDT